MWMGRCDCVDGEGVIVWMVKVQSCGVGCCNSVLTMHFMNVGEC